MKKILVLGTGKSSYYLLEYLNKKALEYNWEITACDRDINLVTKQIAGMSNISPLELDIHSDTQLQNLISDADIAISMLPAAMHIQIARFCIAGKTHMATASYVSDELAELEGEIKKRKLHFLNEMGLDPGIDHLSAMKIIDGLRVEKNEITSFESYCGGLISESCCGDNPWKYKFTWNPMNVILAGQGGMSVYRENKAIRYVPWHRLFANAQKLNIEDIGEFDAYPNRDSLRYVNLYGLENAATFKRGTLRRLNFCDAWQILVDWGFTDNHTLLSPEITTPRSLSKALTGLPDSENPVDWIMNKGGYNQSLLKHIDALQLDNSDFVFGSNSITAAQKLADWLQELWKLEQDDHDEVVMFHRIGYKTADGLSKVVNSSLVVEGVNQKHTAMAKTVGLPLAMGVELILQGNLQNYGVHIPVTADWYTRILPSLESEGIVFKEYW